MLRTVDTMKLFIIKMFKELEFIDETCKWFIRGRLGIEFWFTFVCFH